MLFALHSCLSPSVLPFLSTSDGQWQKCYENTHDFHLICELYQKLLYSSFSVEVLSPDRCIIHLDVSIVFSNFDNLCYNFYISNPVWGGYVSWLPQPYILCSGLSFHFELSAIWNILSVQTFLFINSGHLT